MLEARGGIEPPIHVANPLWADSPTTAVAVVPDAVNYEPSVLLVPSRKQMSAQVKHRHRVGGSSETALPMVYSAFNHSTREVLDKR
jgi:hypothetical protein